MLKLLISTFALCGLAAPSTAQTITNLPADSLPWNSTPEGAEFAGLEGDRFVQPYIAMVRLPAGVASPLHIKSANMFGVVIEGTFVHALKDTDPADEVRLNPGAYYKIPAGLPHISKCVSETPCTTFLYQDGAFDFIPVDR